MLQSWNNEDGYVTDGFGSFYQVAEDPVQSAEVVLHKAGIKAQLTEAARLQYFMDKPTRLVDLKITIYFANTKE